MKITRSKTEQAEFDRVDRAMEDPNSIFVFGSNLNGWHGAGAARDAAESYGAIPGKGFGMQGRSYAIPTKDREIETLLLGDIADYIQRFFITAEVLIGKRFIVTRIGCGLAGYSDNDIAPLFTGAPENCELPIGWREIIASQP